MTSRHARGDKNAFLQIRYIYDLQSIMFTNFYIYITTNQYRTTVYIGVTNNIQRRIGQHYFDSQNEKKSFAGKYNCYELVYYEGFQYAKDAITREKQLKRWSRQKKNQLIETVNPKWESLNNEVF
ncbi:GIY-YIG nuclease family protein [Dokdonia donghaensis]|nr:GIY-YIG nuclease family protein [Dokdonia donghaensis]ANH59411.1 GIY-YIG nuclease superfamily protein [Dokdonia donghaensis DSW-1]